MKAIMDNAPRNATIHGNNTKKSIKEIKGT